MKTTATRGRVSAWAVASALVGIGLVAAAVAGYATSDAPFQAPPCPVPPHWTAYTGLTGGSLLLIAIGMYFPSPWRIVIPALETVILLGGWLALPSMLKQMEVACY